MIEKVSFLDTSVNCVDYKGFVHNVAEGGIINKINEIINILNAIVVDTKDGTFIDGSKKVEPADPYAEQRKWIGKLCRFWDDDNERCTYEFLIDIANDNSCYPYIAADVERKSWGQPFKHCEPVSEDLIYKGE